MPLRDSSNRPTKPIVPPARGYPGSRLRRREELHVDAVRDDHRVAAEVLDLHLPGQFADRDPAGDLLQERLQHRTGTRCSHRERGFAVWKVATIGPSATISARKDRLGATGSCTCSTSNLPARIHRRTLVYDTGPNESRATEPLYWIGMLRPDGHHELRELGGAVAVVARAPARTRDGRG